MALDRLTKVDGGGISTTSDYRVGIITASKFVGPFDGTGGNFSGVVTATNGVFSGNISAVDGNFSGNVTIGGTLTYEDVTNIDSVGLITARDGIFIPDTKKAQFGNAAGNVDLEIYSTGAESVIKNNTYAFFIQGGTQNNSIYIRPTDNENSILATSNGSVSLYYDNAKKFETVPNGVTVTGSSTFSQLKFKTSDGTNRGSIYADNSNNLYLLDGQDHQFIQCIKDGAVNIRHDNSIVLRTYSSGVEIVGALYATSVDLSDNQKILLGTGDDTEFYHNGSNLYLQNDTGHIYIQNNVAADVDKNIYLQAKNGENSITCENDGEVYLFSNQVSANQQKLRTSNTGIYVTGIGTFTDKVSVTGSQNSMLTNNQLIFDRAGTSYIDNTNDSGSLSFRIGSSYTVGLFIDSSANVSIPSKLMHHGDTDTFLEFASNTITFDTAGSERLRITSDGKIGVNYTGTPPSETMMISSTDSTTALSVSHTSGGNRYGFRLSSIGGTNKGLIISNFFNSSYTEALRIDPAGNLVLKDDVAQGNSLVNYIQANDVNGNPQYILGQVSTGNQDLYLQQSKNASLRFQTNASTRWKINGDPGHLLPEVAGAVDIGSASAEIGNVYIADDKKLYLGSSQDVEIYHSSGNVTLFNSTTNRQVQLKGDGGLLIRGGGNQNIANFVQSGVTLYHSVGNAYTARFVTTSTGITVTGEVAASQDYPNFRPTLDFNFAAEKKLDPRITYTRTGLASFIDEFGLVKIVGDNTPRFDHVPTTRECKGLLIEESRTNLLTYSVDFASLTNYNANYSAASSTLTSTTELAPDGTNTASKYVRTSGQGTGEVAIIINNSLGLSNGTVYTSSVFVKNVGTYGTVEMVNTRASDVNDDSQFNLSTGTIITEGSNNSLTTITPYPNGWYRISVTATHNNLSGYFWVRMYGQPEGSGFILWGGQVEAGPFPTSYIPTNNASVNRGRDIVDIDGEDFTDFYNQTESTIISSHTLLPNVPNAENVYVYQIQDASTNNAIRVIDKNSSYSNVATAIVINSGSSQGHFNNTTDSFTKDKVLVALSVKNNDFAASHNGSTAESITNGTLPTNMNSLGIGRYPPSGGYELNGHFQRFIYYPKQLSDSQLKTITA